MSKYDDSVTRIIDHLRTTFGSEYTYYDGDTEVIPLFNLPAFIVDQEGDDTQEGAMGEDDIEDRLIIKVVLNKRDDFDGDKVNPLNTTARKVRDLVGKRDPTTGDYAAQTVKHVVRSLLLDGVEAVGNSMTVEYGPVRRISPDEDYADLTAEGHVKFAIQYSADTY